MRLLLALGAAVIVVILVVQNANVVSLSVFTWRIEASLSVIVAFCFAFGASTAALAMVPGMYRRRSEHRKLLERIAELEKRQPHTGRRDASGEASVEASPTHTHGSPLFSTRAERSASTGVMS